MAVDLRTQVVNKKVLTTTHVQLSFLNSEYLIENKEIHLQHFQYVERLTLIFDSHQLSNDLCSRSKEIGS